MITVTGRGWYHFLEKPKLLILDNEHESGLIKTAYHFNPDQRKAWISLAGINSTRFTGEVVSGRFRLYRTIDEAQFADGTHLELCEGSGKWNCYVLPRGLPDEKVLQKEYSRTNACVTKCYCGKN